MKRFIMLAALILCLALLAGCGAPAEQAKGQQESAPPAQQQASPASSAPAAIEPPAPGPVQQLSDEDPVLLTVYTDSASPEYNALGPAERIAGDLGAAADMAVPIRFITGKPGLSVKLERVVYDEIANGLAPVAELWAINLKPGTAYEFEGHMIEGVPVYRLSATYRGGLVEWALVEDGMNGSTKFILFVPSDDYSKPAIGRVTEIFLGSSYDENLAPMFLSAEELLRLWPLLRIDEWTIATDLPAFAPWTLSP